MPAQHDNNYVQLTDMLDREEYALIIIIYTTVCPNASGSPTIHTVTALTTALALTGVAMLFY